MGRRKGKKFYQSSGFTLLVSEEDQVSEQIKDAVLFLKKNKKTLKSLSARPDVKAPVIDFAWYFPVGKMATQF